MAQKRRKVHNLPRLMTRVPRRTLAGILRQAGDRPAVINLPWMPTAARVIGVALDWEGARGLAEIGHNNGIPSSGELTAFLDRIVRAKLPACGC